MIQYSDMKFDVTYETFYGFLHRIPSSHTNKKLLITKIVLEFCMKPLQNTCMNNHACPSSRANDVSQCSIVPNLRPYRAMYRSVLQSSALQCNAMYRSALQCSVLQSNVPQCTAVKCIVVQCTTVHCIAVYRSAV